MNQSTIYQWSDLQPASIYRTHAHRRTRAHGRTYMQTNNEHSKTVGFTDYNMTTTKKAGEREKKRRGRGWTGENYNVYTILMK